MNPASTVDHPSHKVGLPTMLKTELSSLGTFKGWPISKGGEAAKNSAQVQTDIAVTPGMMEVGSA